MANSPAVALSLAPNFDIFRGTVENDAINFKILLLAENVVITKFIVEEYIFGNFFLIHNSYSP